MDWYKFFEWFFFIFCALVIAVWVWRLIKTGKR